MFLILTAQQGNLLIKEEIDKSYAWEKIDII